MELKIGARLARLRREKGLTQEQLAQCLGVSAPAVSKWETDSSYPDITLLCPLARALEVNVDTLLRFEEQLSGEEAIGQINAAVELARREGWEAGERQLDALLRQYPNSEVLKYNAALVQDLFPLLCPGAAEETRRRWAGRKEELLADLRASGSGAYWQESTLLLAQLAAFDGRLEEAERLLKELPEQGADPTAVWAQIYLKRGEPEQALKTVQKRLHAQVWQVQSSLAALLSPGVIPDAGQALEVCRAYRELDRLFGLGGMYDGPLFELYLRLGRPEEAADALARYVDVILGTVKTPNPRLFSPGVETAERPASSREMRVLLLQQLEGEQYRPLLGYEAGRAALEKLRAGVEPC